MKARAYIQMLALLLAGCVGGGGDGYPSLARRPAESPPEEEVISPAEEAVPADSALVSEVEGLVQKARKASAVFDTNVSGAQQKVAEAAGSDVSSDAWVAAQLAISTLESDRYDSVSALASLDTLYISRLNAVAGGEVQGGAKVIAKARADVLAIVDRQNDILDGLKKRLQAP